MLSFVATGLAALVQYRRSREATFESRYIRLILATMPGAFAGALALAVVPERVTLAILALFLVVTGARVLGGHKPAEGRGEACGGSPVVTGGVAGFASAMTGTGGPMVLVPLLLWQGVPLLMAVALGQIAQLPIAFVATAGNLMGGGFNIPLAALIAIILVPGVFAGRWAAERVPVPVITRCVAIGLIAAGIGLMAKVF